MNLLPGDHPLVGTAGMGGVGATGAAGVGAAGTAGDQAAEDEAGVGAASAAGDWTAGTAGAGTAGAARGGTADTARAGAPGTAGVGTASAARGGAAGTAEAGTAGAARDGAAGAGGREYGIRPEDLRIGEIGVPAVVRRVEVTGADAYLHLHVAGGSPVVVRHPAATRPDSGAELRVSAAPESWHVFDAETGARI
jgi:hypothetical protein